MKSYSVKSKTNNRNVSTSEISQKQRNNRLPPFEDNRQEAIQLQKPQEEINNNPPVNLLKAIQQTSNNSTRQQLRFQANAPVCQMMFRIENAPGPQKEFTYRNVHSYLQANHPAIVNPANMTELQHIDSSNPIFPDWAALIRRISTQEYTHHNVSGRSRRGSVAEANLLDRIIPAGPAIPPGGLSIAQFQARFQPLVTGGTISTAQLNALLPPGHAQKFPPARKDDDEEIRAGRKWEIPNPVEGGNHEIWVHTNDPRRPTTENAGRGSVVRVMDSTGKYLSDVALTAPADLVKQQAAAAKKGKSTAELDKAIGDKTGQWTKPGNDRGDNQHIPLV